MRFCAAGKENRHEFLLGRRKDRSMAVRKLLTDGVYVDVGCGGGGAAAETVRAACGAAPKRLSGEATLPRARSGRLSANLPLCLEPPDPALGTVIFFSNFVRIF